MRWILRIILFPVRLILSVIVFPLAFLVGIGTWILGIFSTLLVLGAIACFLTGEGGLAITALILAFLVSPLGIPMIAEKLVEGIGRVNGFIKAI